MSAWDDEPRLMDDLRVLHAEGLSFSVIAEKLSHGLSRNACIGKAKRMGLPLRRDAYDPSDARPAKPKQRAPSRTYPPRQRRLVDRGNNHFDLEFDCDAAIPKELPADSIPLAQRKTLLQLEPHHCRFIYGDPSSGNYFYCGGDKYADSYCAYHHSITHCGKAHITDFERERRRQFRLNAERIANEAMRLTG